jgi:elongation factor G
LAKLTNRCAEIDGISDRPGLINAIRNQVSHSKMFGYITDLHSATHGRVSFTMEIDHFAAVSAAIMKTMGH